jgi:hypothetical protein
VTVIADVEVDTLVPMKRYPVSPAGGVGTSESL